MSRTTLKLDAEELQILRDFESGEFESIQHFREEKRSLEAAAKEHSKRIRASTFAFLPRPGKATKTGRHGRDSLPDADRQHLAQVCDGQAQGIRLTSRCTGSLPLAESRKATSNRSGKPAPTPQPSSATSWARTILRIKSEEF
jgi:hypothetical protein